MRLLPQLLLLLLLMPLLCVLRLLRLPVLQRLLRRRCKHRSGWSARVDTSSPQCCAVTKHRVKEAWAVEVQRRTKRT